MKKFLVIGNPIEHSLSPKIHNHWFKENNINAVYEKMILNENDLEKIVDEVKKVNNKSILIKGSRSIGLEELIN